jgi:hypothetical protein
MIRKMPVKLDSSLFVYGFFVSHTKKHSGLSYARNALKAVYCSCGYHRGDKGRSCHAYKGDGGAAPLVPLNEASPDMSGISGP